ncbi:kinase-like domain, Concanavalin A-like lectin/glucanase domain protein [Thalictrum thalictroides]|uniref:non-specific serine/threonine protein kinase n=1 Tax=Thalictrum thalictroides TaxID=46969 RepID=A0A7J6W574_THATH|nr:kinase-like domain, Concanavalin A-like lectin/glucanase domain protein [Thalictrum thalictroides]
MNSSRISPTPSLPVIRASKSNFVQSNLFGAILIGIGAVSIGVMIYICIRKRYFNALKQRLKKRQGGLKARELDLRRFHIEELEKATNNFSEDCLIGSGAFGNVYKGTFEEDGTLAIKRAHSDSFQSVQEFRNEVELVSRVKHRNLVGLMGYCEEDGPKGAKILVYEYVPNGSLLEYIVGRKGKTLTWRQRVNIAVGAAKVDTSRTNSRYHIIEWARPSLELGKVADIIDVNLLSEPCNLELMLKMGQLALRCAVKVPKNRPTMTQVLQELEESFYLTDGFINKQPSKSSRPSWGSSRRSTSDQSFVSVDGIGLQRFHVEMDSLSFQSSSMRCFENNSISIDIDENNLEGISEETSTDVL